jgi:hypothetical protein
MLDKNDGNHIWVSIGVTKNLGNYESFRIDAGARLIGDPSDDDLWKQLWEKVEAEVEEKLIEANQEITS